MATASPTSFIFRSLDADGDWNLGQGLSSYATGDQAIAFDVQTRLLMFFNDFFAAMLFGIQWIQLLGSKNPAAQNGILVQTRQMILGTVGGYASYGVTAINGMNFYLNRTTRGFTLEYDIATIFSTSFSGSLSIPFPTS